MSPLVRIALDTARDVLAPLGLRSVACSTLLHALEAGIEVPIGSHMAVWNFLLGSDASAVVLHRHALEHPDVARDAVRVLTDRNTGESERDLALAVLRGSNVEHIAAEDIATIVDRVLDEGRARQITHMIDRVHEERGLSPEFLSAIRDRLATSTASAVRVASVEVCGLSPRFDDQFVIQMFADEAPQVRAAVADLLERAEQVDRSRALVLIRERLAVEAHRSVISSLHYALGSLVRTTGRRVHKWEPIEEDES